MCQPKMQFWKPLMGFWQTRLSFVMADSMSWLGAVACQFRDNKRDDITATAIDEMVVDKEKKHGTVGFT